MAITYIVGDKLRVNTSYIDAVLAKQTPSSYLSQSLEVLGDLNFEVLTVLAKGTGDFPTSGSPVTLSYLQVVPASATNPRYNGGSGVNVYFSTDTLLNNSFEYATAYIPDIVYVMGKNITGSIIAKGSVVRQSTYDLTAQMPGIDLASAASASTASVLGVTVEDIAIGGTGGILIAGSYQGVDTTGGTVGDPIYLSDTPSAMSISAGTVSVIIGSILSVGSTGSVRFGIGVDQGGGGGSSGPWEEVATVVQLVTPTNSVLVQSGEISSPGSGSGAEQFGSGANTNGFDDATAYGPNTAAGFNNSHAWGLNSSARSFNNPNPSSYVSALSVGSYCQAGATIGAPITNSRARTSNVIAIGDSAFAGVGVGSNTDIIAIGDGLVVGGYPDDDMNGYSDMIGIGDGCSVGAESNLSPTTEATGNGVTTFFTGTLTGAPFVSGPNGGMLISYTIGGTTYTAQSTGSGIFGTNVTTPSNMNFTTGFWQITFTIAPDNGTPITFQPNFGGADLIAIGDGCVAQGKNGIAIGNGSQAGSSRYDHDIIAVGNAFAGGGNTFATAAHDVIALLAATNSDGHGTNFNNVFVAGGDQGHHISDVYFGNGIGNSSGNAAQDVTIHGSGGSQFTNLNGAKLKLAGGVGFNAGAAGGNLEFYTARSGSADTLTLAGYFNAISGTLSVPGAGSNSERFGLNSLAAGTASIAIGNSASDTDLGATVHNNSLVVGSSTAPITNVYFGHGIDSAAPPTVQIRGTGGFGSGVSGGRIQLLSGFGTDGDGGELLVKASNGVGTDRQGGELYLNAGNAVGNASGSAAYLTAGGAGTDGAGGDIQINAGGGGSSTGNGGSVYVNAAFSFGNNGGDVWVNGGGSSAPGANVGNVYLTVGNGSGTQTPGMIQAQGRFQFRKGTAPGGGNIPSATTITLGGPDANANGNYHIITGTTTINGIVTQGWTTGAVVFLKFPDGLTVTNDSGAPGAGAAAISLNGTANFVATAGSTLTLLYDSVDARWIELARMTR